MQDEVPLICLKWLPMKVKWLFTACRLTWLSCFLLSERSGQRNQRKRTGKGKGMRIPDIYGDPSQLCSYLILVDWPRHTDWVIYSDFVFTRMGDFSYLIRYKASRRPAHVSFLCQTPAYNFGFLVSGWTREEAIDSLMRKAGFSGHITDILRKSIRVTRYQSTLFTLTYSDYVSYVRETRGAAPSINGVKHVNHWFIQQAWLKRKRLFGMKKKKYSKSDYWGGINLFLFHQNSFSNCYELSFSFFKFIWFWRNKEAINTHYGDELNLRGSSHDIHSSAASLIRLYRT